MTLHHIGIAVKDIDERLKIWQDAFGLELLRIEEVADQKVRVAVLDCGGIHIELLEALDEQSPIHKFIEKKGEGLHHLCIQVDDITGVLSDLEEKGIQVIDRKPKVGASGTMIAFVHPRGTGGVLIEFCEKR